MTALGVWIHGAIEDAVINRTAGVTALYVDSFVAPIMEEYGQEGEVSAAGMAELDGLLTETALGTQIASFKIWNRAGQILYSPNQSLIGETFDRGEDLDLAFQGEVVSQLTSLEEPENAYERTRWKRLIETYSPVRALGTDQVIAVAEFYQPPDALDQEIRDAQRTGWMLVGLATLVMYLALAGMVARATSTIESQQSELEANVADLEATLIENRSLQTRIQGAASNASALNERYLRRISADIHDGPAQEVALALLRIDDLANSVAAAGNGGEADVDKLRDALNSALTDMRAIAQGLRSPIIDQVGPCEAARRAVADFERIYGDAVALHCDQDERPVPLPVSIAVYRIIQESLTNSFKHARVDHVRVRVTRVQGQVVVIVTDDGVGFDASAARDESHLGLAGMNERVEMLGGSFEVTSWPGRGTVVTARLPVEYEVPSA